MSKRIAVVVLAVLAGSTVLLSSAALAVEGSSASEQQLVQIRTRCSEIRSALSRVHANDALLRVNRGQLYERLSTKLAVPLNARIALNRLDGSTLLSVTSGYDQHLTDFRTHYQTYEEQLSTTMRVDCVKQPAVFYENLQSAREKRQVVHESAQRLARDIAEYKRAFSEFARAYREKQ